LDGGSVRRKAATYAQKTNQNKRTQTSMPRVGLEPTIPDFERSETVHALDRAATVIGNKIIYTLKIEEGGAEERQYSRLCTGRCVFKTIVNVK
jgi:FAD synthase